MFFCTRITKFTPVSSNLKWSKRGHYWHSHSFWLMVCYFSIFGYPVYIETLQSQKGFQNWHFELFTVRETLKITQIQKFLKFECIFQKKKRYWKDSTLTDCPNIISLKTMFKSITKLSIIKGRIHTNKNLQGVPFNVIKQLMIEWMISIITHLTWTFIVHPVQI